MRRARQRAALGESEADTMTHRLSLFTATSRCAHSSFLFMLSAVSSRNCNARAAAIRSGEAAALNSTGPAGHFDFLKTWA